jgi:DNA-binding MarR family transcriptional regulator
MGIKLFVISYKTGRIEELYKQLSKILNTTKQELKILKVKNGVLLDPQEIKQKRKQYKIGELFDIIKLSLQEQSLLINSLKKENLSISKIAQILNLTTHQVKHLITRLNAKGFKIIHR